MWINVIELTSPRRTGIAMKSKRFQASRFFKGMESQGILDICSSHNFSSTSKGTRMTSKALRTRKPWEIECTVFMGHSVWWMWSKISKVNMTYMIMFTMSIETNWFHLTFGSFRSPFFVTEEVRKCPRIMKTTVKPEALCIGRMFVVNESKNQNTCHINNLWYMKTTKNTSQSIARNLKKCIY